MTGAHPQRARGAAGQPTRGERESSVSPSLGGLGRSRSSEAPPPGSFPAPSSSPTRLLELKLRIETGQRQEVAWESLGTSLPRHRLSPATPNKLQSKQNQDAGQEFARSGQGPSSRPASSGCSWNLLAHGAALSSPRCRAAGITLTWELVRPHSRPRAELPGDCLSILLMIPTHTQVSGAPRSAPPCKQVCLAHGWVSQCQGADRWAQCLATGSPRPTLAPPFLK